MRRRWPRSRERPIASYRFQLTPSFGFDDVVDVLDVVATMGISHLYLSPIAEAIPGSTHGYDVVDHTQVRAEFGGRAGLERLLDRAHDRGLRVVIDHVPNHVSVARPELNEPWWTMLRDGPTSPAARWFDVDRDVADGRVVVPRLGAPVDEVLASGELVVDRHHGEPVLRLGDLLVPLAPGTEHLAPAEMLDAQHHRLTWWRDPVRNVRRFFTIDDLVAVRVEHDEVARQVDTLPRELCSHPAFGGVRVDHVDGLADPGAYLDGLRETIGERWLLVEKILAPDEALPAAWPVDGTTGYEHVVFAEHTLLDPTAHEPLVGLWTSSVNGPPQFHTVEDTARRHVLDTGLRPDLERLQRATERAARHADVEPPGERAIVALTIAMERYRTYLGDGAGAHDDADSRRALDAALRRVASDEADQLAGAERFAELVRTDAVVCARWQQLTGPVMAKGAEDRAFYRWFPLASLCEVGGAPGSWTFDVETFHRHQERAQSTVPTGMLTATTHDTKRSDAVRSRSLALAARADAWVERAGSWPNQPERVDPVDVHLALQTAVTARPLSDDRLGDYLVKAAREAEIHTSWTDPSVDDERALRSLAEQVLADPQLEEWAHELSTPGAVAGLALLALQLTCPGVPDLYQGAPAQLTSLVDPDNRRPPDWDALRMAVDEAGDTDVLEALGAGRVDVARAALIRRVLDLRRRRPGAFGPDAGYARIEVSGRRADDVVAFTRLDPDGEPACVVAVRRVMGPDTDWSGTVVHLPDGRWHDLTGSGEAVSGTIPCPPVAVLSR